MNPLDLVPSMQLAQGVTVDVAACAPSGATAIGIPVAAGGAVPDELGIGRAALGAAGFDGAVGQALALPGTGPAMRVAFGIGDSNELDAPRLRYAAAAFSQTVRAHIALTATLPGLSPSCPEGRLGGDRRRDPARPLRLRPAEKQTIGPGPRESHACRFRR